MTSPEPSTPRGAGGFLLSPPASSVVSSSSTADGSSSSNTSTLPLPRSTPLRPGGSKESTFIRYVDQRLLHIQRRFAKRTTPTSAALSDIDRDKADAWGDVRGYASMREACADVDAVLAIIWISGTPTLQIPYLLSVGLLMGHVLEAMPPTPRSLFRVLAKLDHAFASLLLGRDVVSGAPLPGFGFGVKGVSATEKVRVRSLVERTRVNVVEAFKRGEFEMEEADESAGMETESELEGELVLEGRDHDMAVEEEEDDSWDMQIARVYDRTLVELGDSLEEPNIGIITETRG